jgi:histidinol-phosphate aminotransferase
MQKTRELTRQGRDFLQSEFSSMNLEFVPSAANFVLVRVGDGDKIFEALLRRGLIVRAMRSYKLPEWIRVSVGTMDQNRRLIAELRGLLAGGASEQPAPAEAAALIGSLTRTWSGKTR